MKLLDSHHHLWNLKVLDYIWLKQIGKPKPFGDPTPIQKDYLKEDFLSDFAKIDKIKLAGSVHIQVDSALEDPVKETDWLSEFVLGGIPSAIVGYVDLTKEDAEDILKRHLNYPKFRGVRQIIGKLENRPDLSFIDENLFLNKCWQKNFALLEKYNLNFDLQLYPEQMNEASEFLSDYPEIPVVIDHAGCPYDQSDSGLRIWKTNLSRLAALPNLHIKLSGFGMYDKNWSSESAQIIFDTILEQFTPKRIMWGSNFPVERLVKPYSFCVKQILKWLSPLSTKDKKNIASETALSYYNISEISEL
tara:strand:- start:657 stop:1568 length:912 start_codon:yes stop_codon:yes gene_type:complete